MPQHNAENQGGLDSQDGPGDPGDPGDGRAGHVSARRVPPAVDPRLTIRGLEGRDCAATAELHHEHLSVGMFPQLGPGFLSRWHRTFVAASHGWGAVAVDDRAEVVGFVLVATDAERYVSEVLATQRWRMGAAGAVALLRRPSVAVTFLRTRTVRYARRLARQRRQPHRDGAPTSAPAATAVVYAMVTAPATRGRGLGRHLLDAAVQAARSDGAAEVHLLTRAPAGARPPASGSGSGAASFYEHLGWRRARTLERDGAVLVEFCLSLQ